MNTEVLTYSRSKGVFAGLTLEGAVVEQDNDSTRAIYGKHMTFRNILSGKVSTPRSVEAFIKAVSDAGQRALQKQVKTRSKPVPSDLPLTGAHGGSGSEPQNCSGLYSSTKARTYAIKFLSFEIGQAAQARGPKMRVFVVIASLTMPWAFARDLNRKRMGTLPSQSRSQV
jgi:hypothetical protein